MSSHIHRGLLVAVGLLALGLRLWRLESLPPGFHFDEAFEGLEAWRIYQDPAYRPIFLTGNFGVLPLNSYANALVFALVDQLGWAVTPTTMRFTSALIGALTVVVVYGLAYELARLERRSLPSSRIFALLSATVLALMQWHLHFSRMGIEPIWVPLLWAGSTALLVRGWRTEQAWPFAVGGFLLASAMYAYQGAWIMPLLAIGIALSLLIQAQTSQLAPDRPRWVLSDPRFRGLLLAGGVAALTFAPLGWYFWQHPDQFLLRPAQIAVVGDGEAAESASVWQTSWATVKMFGPFGTPGDQDPRRNLPGAPALNLWLVLPFYLGVGLALWRIRRPTYVISLLGLTGLVLPGVFSEYAPHFHRILGAAAPTALLCGLGLDWLWQRRASLRPAVLILLVLAGVTTARDYFVRWAALPDLFYAFDEGLWQVGQQIAAMPADAPIYLSPRTAEHPTIGFALATAANPVANPHAFDGRHIFPLTAQANPQPEHYVVILPEDFRTPLLLPEVFPTATVVQTLSDWQGNPYAHIYQRPAQSEAQRPPFVSWPLAIGDGIRLAGYDVQPATLRAGEILYLQLHWLVETTPTVDWTVFVHLLAGDDQGNPVIVAGHDSQPGAGSLPTLRWQPGWRILDEYQLALPGELPAGRYTIEIGLYGADERRLPTTEPSFILGEVTLE